MATRIPLYSAETYVNEPRTLWTDNLPEQFREHAFTVRERNERTQWVTAKGRMVGPRAKVGGDGEASASHLVTYLEKEGIDAAVVYPWIAMKAYQFCPEADLLDAVLKVANDWLLAYTAAHRSRLSPVMLLNTDNAEAAAEEIRRTVPLGAGAFAIPVALGEGKRYDQPAYECIWQAAGEAGRPIVMVSRSQRPVGRSVGDNTGGDEATLAARLSWQATAVFAARRSITAMTYAGIFERYPALHVGAVGFGVAWEPFAWVRADEIYAVRPERTGPPTRLRDDVLVNAEKQQAHLEGAGFAKLVAGEERSGTTGMAPEGWGFNFAEGERFSTHFRKHVFSTFFEDRLAVKYRETMGVDSMLWAQSAPMPNETRDKCREHVDAILAGVSDDDRRKIMYQNTARIFGLAGAAN
jgi:predicted TIM-barrel fold metal-dependent hydrolase